MTYRCSRSVTWQQIWPLDVHGHLPVVLLDSHELLPEPQETAPHARLLRLPQLKVRLPHLIVIMATYWNRQACLLTKLLYVNVNKTNSSNLIIMESLNLKGANFQFWIDNFYRGFLIFLKFFTMIGEWLYMKTKYSIYFDIHVHVVQFICKYRLRVSWKYNRSWSSF